VLVLLAAAVAAICLLAREFGSDSLRSNHPVVLGTSRSLTGTVTDVAGDPVTNAALTLRRAFLRPGSNNTPAATVTETDASGSFTILNVLPGYRSLTITAQGYANQMWAIQFLEGAEELRMDVTLDAAEMIGGRIVDRDGQPIAGAEVLAMGFNNRGKQCRDLAKTDEEGAFCLSGIGPDSYTIRATASGYCRGHEGRVRPGDTDMLIVLNETGVVTGRVIAGDGPPPVPFRARLRSTYPGHPICAPIGREHSFEDEGGVFELDCPAPGTYCVEALAPGFAPTFSEEFCFTVGQPIQRVVVHLTKGGSIVGRVVDAKGQPVDKPQITTHDNVWTNSVFDQVLGDEFPTNTTRSAVTGNPRGEFALPLLHAETYQLRIRGTGFCELILRDIIVTEDESTDIGDVTMIHGGEITGNVVDGAGRSIIGASVCLHADLSKGILCSDYRCESGAEGKYTIARVSPGKHTLTASRQADDFSGLGCRGLHENGRLVTVNDGDSLRFELRLEE